MDREIEYAAGPSDGEEVLGTSRRRYRIHAREATSALGSLRHSAFNYSQAVLFEKAVTQPMSHIYEL